MLLEHLLNKERMGNIKIQQIQDIFIKNNQKKPVVNTIWIIKILKIYQQEQALDKILRDKALNIAQNQKYEEC